MPLDVYANFAVASVATPPAPAASGTSVVVTAGQGSRFPAVPFNATVWSPSLLPDPTSAEIVRVTARTADTLTIARTQEGSTARTILSGDLIAATITNKTLTDLQDASMLTTGTLSDARLSVNVLKYTGGYPGGTTNFLRADGTFVAPPGGTASPHHATHEPGGTDALVNAAWTNVANVFTQNQTISKTRPEIQLQTPGDTTKARFESVVPGGRVDLSTNLYYDGVAWRRDDPTKSAGLVTLFETGQFGVWRATAGGAEPLGANFLAAFIVDASSHASVAGRLQVGSASISASCPALRAGAGVGGYANAMEFVSGDAAAWATVRAANFVSVSSYNNLADLTCGATNFTAGVTCTAGDSSFRTATFHGRVYIGATAAEGDLFTTLPIYPGRYDTGWTVQSSWWLGSHGSYGLYSNTGLYISGSIWSAASIYAANHYDWTPLFLTDAATVTLDAATRRGLYCLVMSGNRTLATPTNPSDGQKLILLVYANGGNFTLTLGAGFRFGSDIPGTTPTINGLSDYIGCQYTAWRGRWDVVAYVKGY